MRNYDLRITNYELRRKRLPFFLFFILITHYSLLTTHCSAQQLPQFSQYMYNHMAVNPGVTGSTEHIDLKLHHRSQWVGFEGSPTTQLLVLNATLDTLHSGLGGYVFNDMTGPIRSTGINLSYAYRIQATETSLLSFGISASAFQFNIDGNKLELYDEDDALIYQGYNDNSYVPDAGFGAYLYDKEEKYYFGFSVLHLVGNDIDVFKTIDSKGIVQLARHYYLSGSYKFKLSEKFFLQPAFLMNYLGNNPTQFDVNLRGNYDDRIELGVSYRTGDAVVLMTGVTLKERWHVSYSYDITITNLRTQSSGSHEIILGYDIPKKSKKKEAAPRIQ